VGIYGVLAYVVSQREREIGVRMALGAPRLRVVRMVLTSAALLVGTGLAIGATASWVLARYAEPFLFRMQITDPRVSLFALGTLMAAGLAAGIVPARRAARVDPIIALRSE
jgi:ABC-type antimicrobial peptide transport system permease subunit